MSNERTISHATTASARAAARVLVARRSARWSGRAAALAAGLTTLLAGAAAASTVTATNGPLKATFTAKTHDPNCKQKWPITITATYQGKPAHATAYYQFLLDGSVESTQYPFSGTRRNPGTKAHPNGTVWHFVGGFTDSGFGPFGALATSVPSLTVRAVIQEGQYTAEPSFTVHVVKVSGCPVEH